MSWLISLFSSALAPIAIAVVGFLGLIFHRWQIARKNNEIDELQRINAAHVAIQKSHEQDVKSDQETDMRIDALRDKVSHEEPQKGAQDISGAINEYFTGEKK